MNRRYQVPEGTTGDIRRGSEVFPIEEGEVDLPVELGSELGYTPVPMKKADGKAEPKKADGKASKGAK